MHRIPLYLVTGFLGSGKTTLIKNILQNFGDSRKIAIVQNEFAPANVDSIDLRITGKPFELLEVNRGSIFCVCLLNDFILSLESFIDEYKPDMLILESSGLADPITIAELIEAKQIADRITLSKVFTVVDAINFSKLKNNTRVIHQIRVADEIIVNKKDLFTGSLDKLINEISNLNPLSIITSTSFCRIEFNELEGIDNPVALSKYNFRKIEASGRPEISAKVLKTRKRFQMKKLKNYIESDSENLLRIKGYLNSTNNRTLAIQFVHGNLEIKEIADFTGSTQIIAMGNSEDIGTTFKEMLELAEN